MVTMKNEKNKILVVVIAMIALVIILGQNAKKEGTLTPPSSLTDCNVIYRASWMDVSASHYINNPPSGVGANDWIYYRETETVYRTTNYHSGGCNIDISGMTHLYGGIYYDSSSNQIYWKGTNTKDGDVECITFSDAQGMRDDIAEYSHCHVPYNMYYGSTAIGMYDKLVLCDFGNSIGPCSGAVCTDTTWSPSKSSVCSGESFTQTSNCGNIRTQQGTKDCGVQDCNTDADSDCNGEVSDSELLSYAQKWLDNEISDSQLLQAASVWLS